MSQAHWGVVYSSHSGSYKEHKRWHKIRSYIESKGVQFDFVQSESTGSVERLTNMMCVNGYNTIIVVGGDGALNEALNAVMSHHFELSEDFALGVIPNGIGNDFARFWGFSIDDYKGTIDRLIERRLRRIDVATCEFTNNGETLQRYFLNCVNIGLGARLIRFTNEAARVFGTKRLVVLCSLIGQLFERRLQKFTIETDAEHIEDSFMSVCIGNALGYGQTPNAVPYNGFIDMTTITRPTLLQMFKGFWLLGKKQFLNYANVHPYRTSTVTIRSCGKATVSLDGKTLPAGIHTPITIKVLPEALNFII